MSLSRAQVQIVARSEPFASAIREALIAIAEISPMLWNLTLIRQRHRTRIVTRRKQRRSW